MTYVDKKVGRKKCWEKKKLWEISRRWEGAFEPSWLPLPPPLGATKPRSTLFLPNEANPSLHACPHTPPKVYVGEVTCFMHCRRRSHIFAFGCFVVFSLGQKIKSCQSVEGMCHKATSHALMCHPKVFFPYLHLFHAPHALHPIMIGTCSSCASWP